MCFGSVKGLPLYRVHCTRVSVQSSELGPPNPSLASECSPPLGSLGGIHTRLDRHSGTLYSNPFTIERDEGGMGGEGGGEGWDGVE